MQSPRSRVAIVDLQGFKTDANVFVAKEVAVLANGTQLAHWTFAPPYPWYHLTPAEKRQAAWLTNHHHGFRWSDGDVPYYQLRPLLQSALANTELILVKGLEKKRWLHTLAGVIATDIDAQLARGAGVGDSHDDDDDESHGARYDDNDVVMVNDNDDETSCSSSGDSGESRGVSYDVDDDDSKSCSGSSYGDYYENYNYHFNDTIYDEDFDNNNDNNNNDGNNESLGDIDNYVDDVVIHVVDDNYDDDVVIHVLNDNGGGYESRGISYNDSGGDVPLLDNETPNNDNDDDVEHPVPRLANLPVQETYRCIFHGGVCAVQNVFKIHNFLKNAKR